MLERAFRGRFKDDRIFREASQIVQLERAAIAVSYGLAAVRAVQDERRAGVDLELAATRGAPHVGDDLQRAPQSLCLDGPRIVQGKMAVADDARTDDGHRAVERRIVDEITVDRAKAVGRQGNLAGAVEGDGAGNLSAVASPVEFSWSVPLSWIVLARMSKPLSLTCTVVLMVLLPMIELSSCCRSQRTQ